MKTLIVLIMINIFMSCASNNVVSNQNDEVLFKKSHTYCYTVGSVTFRIKMLSDVYDEVSVQAEKLSDGSIIIANTDWIQEANMCSNIKE